MIYLINIFIIILAIVFALQLANEKKAFIYSCLFIITGLGFHVFEAIDNKAQGKCTFTESTGFISNIDNCIAYESGSMLFAQAAILAGFVIFFVKLATKTRS